MEYRCKICNKSIKLLKNHLRISHKINSEIYFNEFKEEIEKYNLFNIYQKDERKRYSPNCIEFYLNKGYSEEEAKNLLEQHRSKQPFRNKKDFRPNQIGFWLKKGYGEEEAKEKLKEFQSNDLNSLIKKYGEELGKIRYIDYIESLKKRKDTEISNYINNGLDEEKAVEKFNKKRRDVSPRRIEYWMNLGYNEDVSNILISEWQDTSSIKKIMKKYNLSFDDAILKQDIHINKILDTKLERGLMIPYNERNDFEYYKLMVWRETNKNYRLYKTMIDANSIRGKDFHLDHKYSIFEGFVNEIDYKIIGSIYNLEILECFTNLSKNIKCTITKEDLIKKYKDGNENKN